MNNSAMIAGIYQVKSASDYTVLQPASAGTILFGPAYRLSSSWRKFVHTPAHQPQSESLITVIAVPLEKTTTEGPTVLKPTPRPEDYEARIESFLHFLDSLGSETETGDDVTD